MPSPVDFGGGKDLFVLTGPTAVGKTEVALRWAEQFNAEIVSSDSLLFYKGMDIGTAKPSLAERERVRHHLIDVAEPGEPWNVERYLAEAVAAVRQIRDRGKRVLVTGGSGFYLKSFFGPVIDSVEVPPHVVRQVAEWEREGIESLAARLLSLDPQAGNVIDLRNPRRVKPALERCLAAGKSVKQLQADMRRQDFPFAEFTRHLCLLSRDRDELRERIAIRVDQMLNGGLVEEVRGLLDRGLLENPSAASAIGYRETIHFLSGGLAEADLREEIIRNTNRLVKKQLTWFRHQLPPGRTINLSTAHVVPEELFAKPG